MVEFKDPFDSNINSDLCDSEDCAACDSSPDIDDCFVCGYPSVAYENCRAVSTPPCLDGATDCLSCESFFNGDIKFLGGYVSGFNCKIGFGASESTVNIDIVLPKVECPQESINISNGVCCLPTGCSSIYSSATECDNAGGIWHVGVTCDDDPCCDLCSDSDPLPQYEGKLGHIYTFSMGAFCFRGILTNHTYNEDASGYKYRITLVDGRSILNNIPVLIHNTHIAIPNNFIGSIISLGNYEKSIIDNTCGNGNQCIDFMSIGLNDIRGAKLKTIFEKINKTCISIPVSGAGLKINLNKLILIVSPECRTKDTESSLLELITLGCEESGYDFIIHINNDNEFEVTPVNYKRPATDKSLFTFIENLSANDIVISKDYGEEMAGGSQKNKRIVIGDSISYLTSVIDYNFQRYCDYSSPIPDPDVCKIFNQPSSIGLYDQIEISPTPLPSC